nr:putative baseplate assembly protein [Kofleriaceae bacterium]
MIPPPKLDPRTFHDLVSEAIALIPRYAPEWTNHGPADPGVTLIELAAWMTEQLVQRVNQVPDQSYVAFLNLLGISQRPARAARAIVRFSLVDGAAKQRVPRGTQVATPHDERVVTFETARDVVITSARPDRCFSSAGDTYSDHSKVIDRSGSAGPRSAADGQRGGGIDRSGSAGPRSAADVQRGGAIDSSSDAADVFAGAQRVERYLYVSDPRFASCGDAAMLRLFLGAPERGGRDLARALEWEHWDGARWRELAPAPVEVERGEVCFAGPIACPPTTVHHATGPWLRGRLAEVPRSPEDTELDVVRARVEIAGDGIAPSHAYASLDTDALLALDLGKNIYPFGKHPKVDCVLYLAADDALAAPGAAEAEIAIDVQLADASAVAAPNPADQLVLAYEYWDGKRWRCLGRSAPRGVLPGAGDEHAFFDDTAAMSRSGTVSFRRPRAMAACELNGVTKQWLRVRVETGDYGEPGSYTLDHDKWRFADDRPLRPPALRGLAVRYREDYRDARCVLACNDFAFVDVTEQARVEHAPFQPFTVSAEASPAFYVGYPARPPAEPIALYVQLDDELATGAASDGDDDTVATPELTGYTAARRTAADADHRVVWEYETEDRWEPLPVTDDTRGFLCSGFVTFVPPDDWATTARFMEQRLWLRARLEHGGYVAPPRVRTLVSNAVDAHHHETIRDEVLGSSDGSPLQQLTLLRGPLLGDVVLEVREKQRPASDDVADLGADALRSDAGGDTWVRYRRVDSFYASGPASRHYTLDHATGVVRFGDGRRGATPPAGSANVVASYRVGGGASGNVNAGTLTSLGRALAYIAGVTNPLPAAGGADRESVDDAKARAPHAIKSRDRAVTAEDFEALALRASTQLARARCVPDRTSRGHVVLAVVPKADARELRGDELARRLVPSGEVRRQVARYLDDRKLLGTVLDVVRPRYQDLSLRVTLSRRGLAGGDRVRRDVEAALRRYLHALIGGRAGKGWEFGRPVLKVELVHLVEGVPGVDGVDALDIRDETRGCSVEHLRLDDDELPFVATVHVTDMIREVR